MSFQDGMDGSDVAALRWTEEQKAQVDAAIRDAAQLYGTFTADDVWFLLGSGFLVTKGLTSRLMRAKRAGLIRQTGEFRISERGGEHDHAQRLTVWEAV